MLFQEFWGGRGRGMDLALPWSLPGLETNKKLPYRTLEGHEANAFDRSLCQCLKYKRGLKPIPGIKKEREGKGLIEAFKGLIETRPLRALISPLIRALLRPLLRPLSALLRPLKSLLRPLRAL
jgi:hypothetical protein